MSSYVIAGYLLTFGVLGLYALRTVVRARQVAALILEHDRLLGADTDVDFLDATTKRSETR